MNRKEELLWKECKLIFNQTKNTETDKLLNRVINIVKKHETILRTVADNDFLNYIISIVALTQNSCIKEC